MVLIRQIIIKFKSFYGLRLIEKTGFPIFTQQISSITPDKRNKRKHLLTAARVSVPIMSVPRQLLCVINQLCPGFWSFGRVQSGCLKMFFVVKHNGNIRRKRNRILLTVTLSKLYHSFTERIFKIQCLKLFRYIWQRGNGIVIWRQNIIQRYNIRYFSGGDRKGKLVRQFRIRINHGVYLHFILLLIILFNRCCHRCFHLLSDPDCNFGLSILFFAGIRTAAISRTCCQAGTKPNTQCNRNKSVSSFFHNLSSFSSFVALLSIFS